MNYPKHKGIDSTLLLIGGSALYTGAPYLTALSSHRSGFTLTYVMTHEEALLPLKILLPESIILPITHEKWILDRINICIIGPGLGRPAPHTQNTIQTIIKYLMQKNIFFIFDGDGIHLFTMIRKIFTNYTKIVLTPNYNEIKKISFDHDWYVVEKGGRDIVRCGDLVRVVDDEGSGKRSCGLGDVFCGIVAFVLLKSEDPVRDLVMGCRVMRRATYEAWGKRGRSMMARDVVEEIGAAFGYIERIH